MDPETYKFDWILDENYKWISKVDQASAAGTSAKEYASILDDSIKGKDTPTNDIEIDEELLRQVAAAADAISLELVGSQTIDGAATADSDIDILVLVSLDSSVSNAVNNLYELGAQDDSEETYKFEHKFKSIRIEKYNFILTTDGHFYHKFICANTLAQKLKLTDRDDRVTLFQYVLYGNV